jgi:hypothetical protein
LLMKPGHFTQNPRSQRSVSVMAILQQLRRLLAIPEEPNPVLTPN